MTRLLSLLLAVPLIACSGGDADPASSDPATADGSASDADGSSADSSTPASSTAGDGPAADGPTDGDGTDEEGTSRVGVKADLKTGFTVNSNTIPTHPGTVMGGINAFCQPHDETIVGWGGNVSPDIFFEAVPAETKSFALLAYDPDAPASAAGVNTHDITIKDGAERTTFFHWVLVDIPADTREIPEGAGGRGVVEGGKREAKTKYGLRGLNDFTNWFADDPKMKGDYLGFDGACPPWNDDRIHRYTFSVHALDVASLGLKGRFTGADVEAKMKGHLLASASFTTVYWLNPAIQQ